MKRKFSKRKILGITAAVAAVALIVAAAWYASDALLEFFSQPEQLRQWVDNYGIWSRIVFAAAVVLQVVVAILPGEPFEIAAGYAFGAVEGTVLALLGIVLGSGAVYGLVRRFGRGAAAVFFSREQMQSLEFLLASPKSRALAFLLMTVPGTPKDLLSYFAGLTGLGLWEWLGIVAVARIPSVIGSTCSGGAAGNGEYGLAGLVILLTALLSGAGLLYYRHVCKTNAS